MTTSILRGELRIQERYDLAAYLRILIQRLEDPTEVVRDLQLQEELYSDRINGCLLAAVVGKKIQLSLLVGREGVTY